jgi:hypothetical protein
MYPFDLHETKEYLVKEKGFNLDNKSIMELYMVFGGVAKYLSYLDARDSIATNIDKLFFNTEGFMFNEYHAVFRSLFMERADYHKLLIEALCSKSRGLSATELTKELNVPMGGKLLAAIAELEDSGFIQGISKFGNKRKGIRYIVSDPYILFHHKWIKELSRNDVSNLDIGYWNSVVGSQKYALWTGLSFEMVVITNVRTYLKARGAGGLLTGVYYW